MNRSPSTIERKDFLCIDAWIENTNKYCLSKFMTICITD